MYIIIGEPIYHHFRDTIQIIIEHLVNIFRRDACHFRLYVSVLPSVCYENVWTFTRITRIYPLCCVQWISQVRILLIVQIIDHYLSTMHQ